MKRERLFGPARWALGGLLAFGLSFLTAEVADAATLRLGPDCGPTIQDCVDAAADGDVILVPRKTGKGKPNDGYYENVIVNKDVVIRGVNRHPNTNCLDPRRAVDALGRLRRNVAAVVLDAAPAGDPGGIGFHVTADGASIECFLIRHGTNAIRSDASSVVSLRNAAFGQKDNALHMGVAGVTNSQIVVDNLIVGARGQGLHFEGDNDVAVGVWVRNVNDSCFFFESPTGTEDAIYVDNHARRCNDHGFEYTGIAPVLVGNTSDATKNDGFAIECNGPCGGALVANTASNVRDDDDGFQLDTNGNPNLVIVANRAFKNTENGFRLNGDGAILVANLAERNGTETGGGIDGHGFRIFGDDNLLLANVARFNKKDGFNIEGDNNQLGDGNEANRNVAERNLMDGFDVDSGDGNTLNNNLARNNEGDGIENNGTNTLVGNNTSAGNRIDCANSGTVIDGGGNACADGSDFLVPPETERQKPRNESQPRRDR